MHWGQTANAVDVAVAVVAVVVDDEAYADDVNYATAAVVAAAYAAAVVDAAAVALTCQFLAAEPDLLSYEMPWPCYAAFV